jgi:hypothetical protein
MKDYRFDLLISVICTLFVSAYIFRYQTPYPKELPDLLLQSSTRIDKLSSLIKPLSIVHISDKKSPITLRNTQTLERFYFQHPESLIVNLYTNIQSRDELKSIQKQFNQKTIIYRSKKAINLTRGRLPTTFFIDETLNIISAHHGELSYTQLLTLTKQSR